MSTIVDIRSLKVNYYEVVTLVAEVCDKYRVICGWFIAWSGG
jgi:hypothetical protein